MNDTTTTEKTPAKSIVPSKYAGKYKTGGGDDLAKFIEEQCRGKDGFEYPAFFTLMTQNGIAEEKIKHYSDQVAEKRPGAPGRARMTLRNILASQVRKTGKVKDLSGNEHDLSLPKPALGGAAKAQAEKTAAEKEAA